METLRQDDQGAQNQSWLQSDLEANLGYKEPLLQNKVNKHLNSISGHFVEKKTLPGHHCELLVLRMLE